MKTQSHNFISFEQLHRFTEQHKIRNSDQLMIQVFAGVGTTEHVQRLQHWARESFPDAVLIGTTTDGSIFEGEVMETRETILTFTQFEQTALKPALCITQASSFDTGVAVAKALEGNPQLVLTFTDGLGMNGEEYLKGFNSIRPNCSVAGGMAGDHGEFIQTCVFDHHTILTSGAVAVALYNPNLKIFSDYTFNWIPIGKNMRVTRSEGNRVYEIEGMSAESVYAMYLGKEVAERLPGTGIEFPLVMYKNGVLVGRAVVDRKDDGSLIFAGNIDEHELVRFAVGNVEQILNDGMRSFDYLDGQQIESIFVYSCMARRRFMGKELEIELRPLQMRAPMAGFFTNGEFFYHQGETSLLNETMTVVALSEGVDNLSPASAETPIALPSYRTKPMQVMANLVNKVATEFEELNANLEERVRDNTAYIMEQLYRDHLTDLPNRTKLISELASYEGHYLALVNIDDFTTVNDFYGHGVGDYVITSLGEWLLAYGNEAHVRLYRMPGDEFGLVFQGELSADEVEQTIGALSRQLNTIVYRHEGNDIHLSVTISAAQIAENDSGLARADMALKYAKAHKLRYLLYSQEMMFSTQYETNLKIAKSVREAIKHDRIVPYYQPIIDLQTGAIVKYECLARLIESDGSVMSPFHFLPVAQKIHLYFEITKAMVDKAFERFQDIDSMFNINLSFDDIANPSIRDYILQTLKHSEMGTQVTFEILETKQLQEEEMVMAFIDEVRRYGAKVSIDDFGSGFANFENLTRINVDNIKIDGSLIKKVDVDENARIVVETIVAFAKRLKMQTVAEFVHSPGVFNVVRELGIDYGQGYLFGEPVAHPCETIEGFDTLA